MISRLTLLLLIGFAFPAFSGTFVSNGTGGGNFNTAASWTLIAGTDANGIPDADDDITIQAGDVITISSVVFSRHVTINGTLTWTAGSLLYVSGNYTNNGVESGSGPLNFTAGAGTTISGSGTFAGNVRYSFAPNSNRTIAAGTTIVKTNITGISSTTLTNLGNLTVAGVNTAAGATFVNGAGATLTITVAGFMNGRTFNPSAVNNTVNLNYATGAVPVISSGVRDYWNLNINGTGTKTANEMINVDGNLTIGNSAVLNLNGFDLHVGGNFTTTAANRLTNTATNVAQTFVLNGTTAQTVSYTGAVTFPNIVLDNPAGASLNTGTYTISNVLDVNIGTLTANSTTILGSTAATTARIEKVAAGSFAGNFTVQRFLTARDSGFSEFSPVVENTTLADWDNEIAIYGIGGNEGNFAGGSETVWIYDEAVWDYDSVTTSAYSPAPGQGLFMFLFDTPALPFTAKTMNSIGRPNAGEQTIAITAVNDGWNLVGNPFQSWISWDSLLAYNPTLDASFQMYSDAARDFVTYGSGTEIEPGHGFWVRTSSSTTLRLPEGIKTTSTVSSFQRKAIAGFTATLLEPGTTYAHSAIVKFDQNSPAELDKQDVVYHKNVYRKAAGLYTVSADNNKLAVNSLASSRSAIELPLVAKVNTEGTYALSFSGRYMAKDYKYVYLVDNANGEATEIGQQLEKTVILNAGENTDRFKLVFTNTALEKTAVQAAAANIALRANENGVTGSFAFDELKNVMVTIYNSLGQVVRPTEQIQIASGDASFELPDNNQVFIVKCEVDGQTIVKKVAR